MGVKIKFPTDSMKRLRNRLGKYAVPCVVSERWLQFPKKSGGHFRDGEFIQLSVMTKDQDDEPRKLCDLVVTREDLLKAIGFVKPGN